MGGWYELGQSRYLGYSNMRLFNKYGKRQATEIESLPKIRPQEAPRRRDGMKSPVGTATP